MTIVFPFSVRSPQRTRGDQTGGVLWRTDGDASATIPRRLLYRLMLLASAALGGNVPAAEAEVPSEAPEAVSLLKPKSFSQGWVHYSADTSSQLSDTWTIDDKTDAKVPVLICTGKPAGYLRTSDAYENYELTLEWMYPDDPNCNSGVLVHAGKDKIWPASIQVQLHRPFAGSIFPMKGAMTANRVERKDLKPDVGKWHRCRIQSRDGVITVWINDKKVGEVTGCQPAKGYIALQSEGSEIRFRKISLRELKPVKKKPAPQKKPQAKDDPPTERLSATPGGLPFFCPATGPRPARRRCRFCRHPSPDSRRACGRGRISPGVISPGVISPGVISPGVVSRVRARSETSTEARRECGRGAPLTR